MHKDRLVARLALNDAHVIQHLNEHARVAAHILFCPALQLKLNDLLQLA